ncbi:hypothetical protein [Streptomyces lacrimifluminis]|uniref:hypothetical protein n=1 Tax=Streptomyces lacrimifluminis TaxID=1500077 RepID=UPI001E44A0B6|nr:hypothetical protein [Streptomyces lacrimifluminis]
MRSWQKYKIRETSEAIVDAITGSLAVPRTLLPGRYDDRGRFQYVGRTTTLARVAAAAVTGLLATGRHGHPWTGWSFSAGWGQPGDRTSRWWNPSWRWKSTSTSRRLRPVATPRTLAPRPPRPLPADVPRLTSPPH